MLREGVQGDSFDFGILPNEEHDLLQETLRGSSLLSTIFLLEVSRQIKTDYSHALTLILPPQYHSMQTLMELGDPKIATELIKADAEYQTLQQDLLKIAKERGYGFLGEERGREILTSIDDLLQLWIQLLTSDVPVAGKIIAVSENFKDYLKDIIQYQEPGPYYIEALEGLALGDLDVASFIRDHLDLFMVLDEQFFWGHERTEEIKQEDKEWFSNHPELAKQRQVNLEWQEDLLAACLKLQEVTDSYLDTIFNVEDQSPWRKFLMQNFTPIFTLTCMLGYPKDYNPEPELARIKELFSVVAEKDWPLLGRYLQQTIMQDVVRITLDQDIAEGNLERVSDLVEFRELILEGNRKTGNMVYQGEEKALRSWEAYYLDGFIDKQEFLSIPQHWTARREALESLPELIRYQISQNVIFSDLLNEPCIYQDGDLIASIISAGLFPSPDNLGLFRHQPQKLEAITQVNQSLFPLIRLLKREQTLYLKVLTYWADQYLNEQISDSDFKSLAQAFTEVYEALPTFLSGLDKKDSEAILSEIIKLCHHKDFQKESAAIISTLKEGIFPTPKVRSYLQQQGQAGLAELNKLQKATAAGRFDPNNELQKELEYLNYIKLTGGNARYESFQDLPFVDSKENDVSLTVAERLESKAAAFEAANLYWFIKDRADLRRKLVVVGNNRYGELFVVEPMKDYINALGVRVEFLRVSSSSGVDQDSFPEYFEKYLMDEEPDVIVVDGTANSFVEDKNQPRLPQSMSGYRKWFLGFNDRYHKSYKVAHWLPVPADQVLVGKDTEEYTEPNLNTPQLILANPVIDPKHFADLLPKELSEHQPAFFDDPEKYSGQDKLVFTSTGIQRLFQGKTKEQLLELVQEQMRYNLPEMLRLSHDMLLQRQLDH